MDIALSHIFKLLDQKHNIEVTKYDAAFLKKSLQKRINLTQSKSEEKYLCLLEKDNIELQNFLDSLQIGYSEFYRNSLTFSTLEHIIFPMLMHRKIKSKGQEIRIWSAACALGQEAYSIAMLLEEFMAHVKNNINYRIFATDQCEDKLRHAQEGIYHEDSLDYLNMKRVKKWFTKQNKTYTIKSELKKHISFSVFDLLNKQLCCPSASIFGDFDIVVCANFLFYYTPIYQNKILSKANNCLEKDGYIIVGETERDILLKYNYHEVYPQSCIFQRIL